MLSNFKFLFLFHFINIITNDNKHELMVSQFGSKSLHRVHMTSEIFSHGTHHRSAYYFQQTTSIAKTPRTLSDYCNGVLKCLKFFVQYILYYGSLIILVPVFIFSYLLQIYLTFSLRFYGFCKNKL